MAEMKKAKQLGGLARAEFEAVDAYERVINKVEDPVVRDSLNKYRDEHRRHIEVLTAEIIDLGGPAPVAAPMGVIIQGESADAPATNEAAVLELLEAHERAVVKQYEEARNWELTITSKAIVDTIYSDERRHVSYLGEAIGHLRGRPGH